MPFESLGDFIKAAEAVGEVQHIEGADLELDVGGLTELTAERGGPMLVFDKFAGYPAGFRVAANANRTLRRFALAMDLPIDIHPLELLRRWRDKRAGSVPISAKVVKDGPVLGQHAARRRGQHREFPRAALASRRRRALHRHAGHGYRARSRTGLGQHGLLPRDDPTPRSHQSLDQSAEARAHSRTKVLAAR